LGGVVFLAILVALFFYIFSSSKGELDVMTDPYTDVFIDSMFIGQTSGEGTLKLGGIKTGTHTVKLTNPCYGEFEQSKQFDSGKLVQIVYKPTQTEYAQNEFILDENELSRWDIPPAPAVWEIKSARPEDTSGRLHICDSERIGYPLGYIFQDFRMVFSLKLTNGRGAAWAVRMKDRDNYYLFYLLPKSAGPHRTDTFKAYVVRNGNLDLARPAVSPRNVPLGFTPEDEYFVTIEAKGNVITHIITSADTSDDWSYRFEDPDPANAFLCGRVGFRTVRDESFSIDELAVEVSKPGINLSN
jgi:hypothetical protein